MCHKNIFLLKKNKKNTKVYFYEFKFIFMSFAFFANYFANVVMFAVKLHGVPYLKIQPGSEKSVFLFTKVKEEMVKDN